MLLKDVLRGRSVLLIEDRTDIVGAAEADGVVLSRQGCRSLQTGTKMSGIESRAYKLCWVLIWYWCEPVQ